MMLVTAGMSASAVAPAVTPGTRLWASLHDGPGNGPDIAVDTAVSPDGEAVFVTGSSAGSNGKSDYATFAYDAVTGTELWAQRYDGSLGGADSATAITASGDGLKVFVTGRSGVAYATVGYDASTGTKLWGARYNGPGSGSDEALAIAASADGTKVFVTGGSFAQFNDDPDCVTVAYNASTGARLWLKRYDGPANNQDGGFAMAVNPAGTRVFVAASSAGVHGTDYATIAYAASTGTQLWLKRYEGPGNFFDNPFSVAVNPAGTRVFVTGSVWGSLAAEEDYATVAYNAATGALVWDAIFVGPKGSDVAESVAVSPDGSRVFVTGESVGSSSKYDYVTVAYDASNGTRLWLRRYDGPANEDDAASDIAVGPGGAKVFVTGSSHRAGTATDVATFAYNTYNGTQLWLKRYDGPGTFYDGGNALAVSPSGNGVFVIGWVWGSLDNEEDYATIAYAA
jgi:hypothetical protein